MKDYLQRNNLDYYFDMRTSRPVQCQNAVEQHERAKHGSLRLDSGNGGVRNTARFLVGSGRSLSLGLIQLQEDQES
jgi:hypothetical protein